MKSKHSIQYAMGFLLLGAGWIGTRDPAAAQARTQGVVAGEDGTGLFGSLTQKLPYLRADGTPTERGIPCADIIRGSGVRAGFMLSHGGVIPDSVRVSAGTRSLRQGSDYFLDAAGGMLSFLDPIRRNETIRVTYRYIESADKDRSTLPMQGLGLNLLGGTLNLGFGISSDKATGLDFTTYGLSLNSRLGAGGSLNSLFYISTPAGNAGNSFEDLRTAARGQTRKVNLKDAVTDHLISQNMLLKSGALSMRATYQDVGQKFSGFQAMRGANARNADIMAQLGTLEKERGLKRLGFGAGLQLGKKDTAGVDWDEVRDATDRISRQRFGLKSGGLDFSYATRAVGERFTRFNDLREEDRAQLAAEKGMQRSDLNLGFKAGKTGAFGFSQMRASDKSGSLERQAIDLGLNNLTFRMMDRRSDSKFTRLANLSDADKTALALDIRRQFNPNATAAEVTAKDKEQIGLDAGLNRSEWALSTAAGKKGALSFDRFTIGDDGHAIARQTINLITPLLKFRYLDQNIDSQFSRLSRMSDFEKSQFANEVGIHRSQLDLSMIPRKGTSLSLNQLDLSDKLGGMMRRTLAYDAKGVSFKLGQGETDAQFTRSADLAMPEAERKAIEAERGYKRMDFTGSLTAIKGLTLNSYSYDAENGADKLAKSLYKHSLQWAPSKGTSFGLLFEGNSYTKDGQIQDMRAHDLFTFDKLFKGGSKLNMFHDSLASATAGIFTPRTITDFLHYETSRAKPNNWLLETKRVQMSDGKFENTDQMDMNWLANKSMAVHFNTLRIDRGKDPSSLTDLVDWKWAVAKGIQFNGSFAETTTNDKTDASVRSIGVSGVVAKNMNVATNFSEVDQHKRNTKAVKDIAISNVKPIKIAGLKQVTITAKYASVTDQHKKQSELSGGKFQAMLGKHQIAAEYGGCLDPKGNNALARTLSLVSDRNEKLPLHFDVLYKSRSLNHGGVKLVRKYNAAYRMDKKTSINYCYIAFPEDAAGAILGTKSEVFGLKRTLNKNLHLGIDYNRQNDLSKNTAVSKLAAVMSGKLDALSAVEVGYGVDVSSQPGTPSDSQSVHLAYDHQVDADHFITIGTTYTMHTGSTPNLLEANVDLRTRF